MPMMSEEPECSGGSTSTQEEVSQSPLLAATTVEGLSKLTAIPVPGPSVQTAPKGVALRQDAGSPAKKTTPRGWGKPKTTATCPSSILAKKSTVALGTVSDSFDSIMNAQKKKKKSVESEEKFEDDDSLLLAAALASSAEGDLRLSDDVLVESLLLAQMYEGFGTDVMKSKPTATSDTISIATGTEVMDPFLLGATLDISPMSSCATAVSGRDIVAESAKAMTEKKPTTVVPSVSSLPTIKSSSVFCTLSAKPSEMVSTMKVEPKQSVADFELAMQLQQKEAQHYELAKERRLVRERMECGGKVRAVDAAHDFLEGSDGELTLSFMPDSLLSTDGTVLDEHSTTVTDTGTVSHTTAAAVDCETLAEGGKKKRRRRRKRGARGKAKKKQMVDGSSADIATVEIATGSGKDETTRTSTHVVEDTATDVGGADDELISKHDSVVWNEVHIARLNEYDFMGDLDASEVHFGHAAFNAFCNRLDRKGVVNFHRRSKFT